MTGMNGLEAALDLTATKRDIASQRVVQARQLWLNAQVQLDQLESYAQERTMRWAVQSAHCTPQLMHHHYHFMERLDHAIGLQKGIGAEHGRNMEREANVLREVETRLESLRQLVSMRRSEQRLAQMRGEQKLTDEQAALQYRRIAEQRIEGSLQ